MLGTCRYGISLPVFNWIAHESGVQLTMRKEIRYLQTAMYNFVQHVNTTALHWQEKLTSLMNKTTGLTIPQLKIIMCVGTKAQDEKNALNHNKTNHGHKFNIQYSQLLTLSLLTEKIFQVYSQTCVWQIYKMSIFVLSHAPDMPLPKPLNT